MNFNQRHLLRDASPGRTGLAIAITLGTALALVACGGGNDATEAQSAVPAAAEPVPAAAMASSESFVVYQQSLAVDDTIEPKALQDLLPPLDDTAEPTPLGG